MLYLTASEENEPANIDELDRAIEIEGRNPKREQSLRDAVQGVIEDDPSSESTAVVCGQTFCRIELHKPTDRGMSWEEIDNALRPILTGEMIFQTQTVETHSIAYIYVSEDDAHLPISAPRLDQNGI